MATQFDSTMILAILPEIGLLVMCAVILAIDLAWPKTAKKPFGWITAGGLAVVAILAPRA